MSKAKSGGGPNMNKVRNVGVKGGSQNTRKVSPDAAGSIGRSVGNHASEAGGKTLQRPNVPLYQQAKAPVPMGNAVAQNVGKGGPGAGRTVHGSGSQGQHGPAAQGAPGLPSTKGQWPDRS